MKYIAEYTNPFSEDLESIFIDNKDTCPICGSLMEKSSEFLYFCLSCDIEFDITEYHSPEKLHNEVIKTQLVLENDLKRIGNLVHQLWSSGDADYANEVYEILERYNLVPDEDGWFKEE